ncbi:MAG: hypothetical protein C0407_12180 [Desulfobacca sp.]|nr:hypothetical protein [Desulfobacca sp.]
MGVWFPKVLRHWPFLIPSKGRRLSNLEDEGKVFFAWFQIPVGAIFFKPPCPAFGAWHHETWKLAL